jgi:hypothetical protein
MGFYNQIVDYKKLIFWINEGRNWPKLSEKNQQKAL